MSRISHYVASPVRPWLRLRNVRLCKSLHTGPRTYRAHDAPFVRARAHTRTREPTRVHFPCRAAVWVEGTHGRRKQRIIVITVIKRGPLRTRPGSTWKIRYFTFECGGTIRPTQTRESDRTRLPSSPTLRTCSVTNMLGENN